MNIVILGAGRVGESVAESLVSESNDITVIDTNPARLSALQDRLDLRGVVGSCHRKVDSLASGGILTNLLDATPFFALAATYPCSGSVMFPIFLLLP